jgi:hypothetical protein
MRFSSTDQLGSCRDESWLAIRMSTGESKLCLSTFAPRALHDKVPSVLVLRVLKANYINVFDRLFSYKCFIFSVVHGKFTLNVDMLFMTLMDKIIGL